MESSQSAIRYTIFTRVEKVENLHGQWFVHFRGSWESLSLGPGPIDMKAGDEVIITIQRRQHAQAEPTSIE